MTWQQTATGRSQQKKTAYDRQSISRGSLNLVLSQQVVNAWDDDIERHVADYTQNLMQALEYMHPHRKACSKKPYVDPMIWTLRQDKLNLSKSLRGLRRRFKLELLFRSWRLWRRQMSQQDCELAFNYETTLRCIETKLLAAQFVVTRSLRTMLKRSKHVFLADRLKQLPPNTSASTVLKEVHNVVGPTNPKKIKRRSLPIVRREDGRLCADPQEMIDRWVEFFGAMEGGLRMSPDELRHRWRQNLQQFSQPDFHLQLQDLLTLCDLERAFARVRTGKAVGHDAVPPEVCAYNAKELAWLSYSQLLKLALHGHEAAIHKGGQLVQAHKGKGPIDHCDSYRSLLISSHQGKVLHRSLRQHQTVLYERFMQNQQIGGRRGVPVTLGLHHLRSYMRHQQREGRSCGILYLDLKEAFYRILRPLTLDNPWTDAEIASLAQRLRLPDGALADLYDHLRAPNAVAAAGLPHHVRNYLTALHSDTWFYVEGQTDVCRTSVGSRPGDCFADTIFGYLWAKVLRQIEGELSNMQILDHVHAVDGCALFGHNSPTEDAPRAYLGPCWMDDLAICLSGSTADELVQRLGVMISILMDTCLGHAMTPNTDAGKTEVMLTLRGARSRYWQKHFHGPNSSHCFTAIGEHQCFSVRVTGRYKHLGGVVHHTGNLKFEAKQRLAAAHQTFTRHRRVLFCNRHIDQRVRGQIFDSLVMSGFNYGSETWVLSDNQSKATVHAGLIRLYRRLLGVAHDQHFSDEEILTRCMTPSPTEVLRRARLRYLGTLYQGASSMDWGAINQDMEWLHLVEDDCEWLWAQLYHCSGLEDPKQHFRAWEYILKYHPHYWKRLVNRATAHAIQQRRNRQLVGAIHRDIFASLQQHGQLGAEAPDYAKPFDKPDKYGCMLCAKRCASRGGEGAHFFKCHAIVADVRQLCHGTQCAHCLREYHTRGKLQQHLQRCRACRGALQARRFQTEIQAGIGSVEQQNEQRAHDGLVPPLQAQGPVLPARAPIDPDPEHAELIDLWVEILQQEIGVSELQQKMEEAIKNFPISWTRCQQTLRAFRAGFGEELATITGVSQCTVFRAVDNLLCPDHWPFLRDDYRDVARPVDDLTHYTDWCLRVVDACDAWTAQQIPLPVGKNRIVLHAFAGRRRVGDYQWYLEQLMTSVEGITLHVVSLDIIIDEHYGDLSRDDVQQYWLHGIRCGWVHAFLGGPPCCTWSKARAVDISQETLSRDRRGPRPVRSAQDLWGLPSLALRELAQVIDGNVLLGFCLRALGELALQARAGILEHPAEPDDEGMPSVWKLPIVQVLLGLPGMQRICLSQGLLGADSMKPTELLALNLPTLPAAIIQWRVTPDVPKRANIGRDATGQFCTAQLKEYPPAFCGALAQATFDAVSGASSADIQVDPEFLACCVNMQQDFQEFIGPDYAQNG